MNSKVALMVLCLLSGCQLDGVCSQNAGMLPISGIASILAYAACEANQPELEPASTPQAPLVVQLATSTATPDMGGNEPSIVPHDMSAPKPDMTPVRIQVVRTIRASDWRVQYATPSALVGKPSWPTGTLRHVSNWNPDFPTEPKPYLPALLSAEIMLDSTMKGKMLKVSYYMATRLQWDSLTAIDATACPHTPKSYLAKQACAPSFPCQQTCVQALAQFDLFPGIVTKCPDSFSAFFGDVPMGSATDWNIAPDASGHGIYTIDAGTSSTIDKMTFLFSAQGRLDFIPPTVSLMIEYSL